MTQQSILAHVTKEGPGPGRYDSKDSLSSIKFTMRPKLDDARKILTLPGPGSYQIPTTITERGENPVSRFRSSGACIINPNGPRFADDYVTNAPGPGQYDYEKTCINKVKEGKYFINKFKSTSQNTFPHSKRLTGEFGPQEKTPGPGAYKMPSDFGRLEKGRYPSMIA